MDESFELRGRFWCHFPFFLKTAKLPFECTFTVSRFGLQIFLFNCLIGVKFTADINWGIIDQRINQVNLNYFVFINLSVELQVKDFNESLRTGLMNERGTLLNCWVEPKILLKYTHLVSCKKKWLYMKFNFENFFFCTVTSSRCLVPEYAQHIGKAQNASLFSAS